MTIATGRSRPARPGADGGAASTGVAAVASALMRVLLGSSYLEELGFLVLEGVVGLLDEVVGELLQLLLRACHVVLADLAVAGVLVECFFRVPADVTDGDAPLLRLVPRHLDELLASLLGELREH